MAQSQALIQTLKKALKAQGLTYAQVAAGLDLSEASVKRLFAQGNFSLERLDQICRLAGMEITDLVRLMESERNHLSELSPAQEQELVSDIKLLLVAFLVVNGWRYEDILSEYSLQETEVIRYLARLDRLKIIDLLPGNRIKLRISPQFTWRKNGPIQQFFTAHLQEDFLKSRFDEQGECFMFVAGMLAQISADTLIKRLQQLAGEFNNLKQQDSTLPTGQRKGYSLFLAIRPWRPDVFDRLRRS